MRQSAFSDKFQFYASDTLQLLFFSGAKLKCIFRFHLRPRCPYVQHPTVEPYICVSSLRILCEEIVQHSCQISKNVYRIPLHHLFFASNEIFLLLNTF